VLIVEFPLWPVFDFAPFNDDPQLPNVPELRVCQAHKAGRMP
jgi:hypothetical protein